MDNYFNLPKVMKMLPEMNVGCVGTAREKTRWTPNDLHVRGEATFYRFFWCMDDNNKLIMRWIDTNFVLLVSTVHEAYQKLKRPR